MATKRELPEDLHPITVNVREADLLDAAKAIGFTGETLESATTFIQNYVKNLLFQNTLAVRQSERMAAINEQVRQRQAELMESTPEPEPPVIT